MLSVYRALVAFCTEDYGAETGTGYDTYYELKYASQQKLRIIPVQLAEAFPPSTEGLGARHGSEDTKGKSEKIRGPGSSCSKASGQGRCGFALCVYLPTKRSCGMSLLIALEDLFVLEVLIYQTPAATESDLCDNPLRGNACVHAAQDFDGGSTGSAAETMTRQE